MKTNYNTPKQFRQDVRTASWTKPTSGVMDTYVQANVVILPEKYATDFKEYCNLNHKPCPLLEVLDPGSYFTDIVAAGADIRTDVPKYKIYKHGALEDEVTDLITAWRDDLVTFLLGCSFSFEYALQAAGIPIRHQELGINVPMYVTNILTTPSEQFHGPMVVSMRPIAEDRLDECINITKGFVNNHGSPIHLGTPETIGILDISSPDYGDAVPIKQGEVPVFWACGVTPQAVALLAKPELMITHSPGHMFVTDLKI